MPRTISKEITVLYGILQCIDINESVVYRRREKKRIKCIMIDESMITVKEGRSVLVMGSL